VRQIRQIASLARHHRDRCEPFVSQKLNPFFAWFIIFIQIVELHLRHAPIVIHIDYVFQAVKIIMEGEPRVFDPTVTHCDVKLI